MRHVFCISFRVITHMAQLVLDLEGLRANVEYGNGPRIGIIYLGHFKQC